VWVLAKPRLGPSREMEELGVERKFKKTKDIMGKDAGGRSDNWVRPIQKEEGCSEGREGVNRKGRPKGVGCHIRLLPKGVSKSRLRQQGV